ALMIQTMARKEYGDDGEEAIRRVLKDTYDKPGVKADLIRIRKTAEEALLDTTLNKEQVDLVMTGIIDELPSFMIDRVAEHYAPYRLLPLTKNESIAATLFDMLKEMDDGDNTAAN
ncbi:MAG: hypothetical protein V3R96_02455, partial [Dehalococcoidales bacterium]